MSFLNSFFLILFLLLCVLLCVLLCWKERNFIFAVYHVYTVYLTTELNWLDLLWSTLWFLPWKVLYKQSLLLLLIIILCHNSWYDCFIPKISKLKTFWNFHVTFWMKRIIMEGSVSFLHRCKQQMWLANPPVSSGTTT